MTPDLTDYRTWIHAPEGRIIIGLTTFFTCTTLFEIVIFPRILPVERVEQQVLANTQVTEVELRGIKYFCDVNRLSLIGVKFSGDVATQKYAVDGLACWNFGKGDWDVRLSQRR